MSVTLVPQMYLPSVQARAQALVYTNHRITESCSRLGQLDTLWRSCHNIPEAMIQAQRERIGEFGAAIDDLDIVVLADKIGWDCDLYFLAREHLTFHRLQHDQTDLALLYARLVHDFPAFSTGKGVYQHGLALKIRVPVESVTEADYKHPDRKRLVSFAKVMMNQHERYAFEGSLRKGAFVVARWSTLSAVYQGFAVVDDLVAGMGHLTLTENPVLVSGEPEILREGDKVYVPRYESPHWKLEADSIWPEYDVETITALRG